MQNLSYKGLFSETES